jgi:hypothetical protein
VLAMVPVAMLLARIHPYCTIAASIALWAVANHFMIDLPANADEQPVWYFNPFAWQLIFFTGYSLRRQWITVPLDSALLLWGSVVVLLLGLAISLPFVFEHAPPIDWLRVWIYNHSDKTNLDLLQYVHFLAEAYVVVVLLKGREEVLYRQPFLPFVRCGQQALSIYVSCEICAQIGGMAFDHAGQGWPVQIAVNAVAFAVLFAVSYVAAWAKRAPWKRAAAPAMAAVPRELMPAPQESGD